ncbi:RNase adapter RapZ [Azospirillum sp.]|uniref:RNase adapter RapZ n=1 Tax=Azospirillum sp. TaxID=34012 RepID=UPI002D70D242|nr:RNase adapter RapZ [Azospirillum sp.]HYD68700.1 RNase adapter RapZ [Azospirillum sp.]
MTTTPPPAAQAPAPAQERRRILIVTGMSGAGMSITLKALEDLGYESVDNLRLSLVDALVQQGEPGHRPLAIVIDSRTRDFSADAFLDHLQALKARPDLDVRLLFLDCGDEVLQRRFTETRRRHPLATDRPVPDGIQRERVLLAPLRERADVTIDTTQLSIHDLRRLAAGHFALEAQPALQVFVTSFSFRAGVPREADLVFDVRFLTNPHWDPTLRPLTGLDAPVAERVAGDPDYEQFFRHLTDLLRPLLPRYNQEGKSYLTIAVGCTGGRHRSVFVAERLAGWLRGLGLKVGLNHRDLERQGPRPG